MTTCFSSADDGFDSATGFTLQRHTRMWPELSSYHFSIFPFFFFRNSFSNPVRKIFKYSNSSKFIQKKEKCHFCSHHLILACGCCPFSYPVTWRLNLHTRIPKSGWGWGGGGVGRARQMAPRSNCHQIDQILLIQGPGAIGRFRIGESIDILL